jgi:D-alanyl-lipoteichoic acid acyltransferase DltB (MBOAT superfamily)
MHINKAYNNVQNLQWMGAWMTSLGYTMQLYFDFSGYADMAIGSALLFGIQLPENFNSPYQALTIQEFWRRWHMSLSTWLKNYIYIPLGGSHCAPARICSNLFLTFLIGGIWHGAGWTFFVWGALHGLAAVVHRLWLKTGYHLNHFLSWFITFNFVNIAWVFFRANSMSDACTILSKMFDFRYVISHLNRDALDQYVRLFFVSLTGDIFHFYVLPQLLMAIVACLAITLFLPNTRQMVERFCEPSVIKTVVLWCCFTGIVLKLFGVYQQADFLYWQF